ncbi:MAG TPA: hypothetical protein VFK45_12275 [Gammaproteobacteria bacterium]|nr:hypothetical protein [Gammaproteobacteria bacterium]
MSDIDVIKGQIAYLKLWLGFILAADASLIAWLATTGQTESSVTIDLAAIAAILLTVVVYFLDRLIRLKIKSLVEYDS